MAAEADGPADYAADYPAAQEPRMDPPPAIGTDERRMHVRAYNFWVSLLDGRPFPTPEALNPASLPDFGPHGVLLDFTDGASDPAIAYLGAALRTEGGLEGRVERISDVPGRSLLSRLTDHYLQILANRAPIGFEAEFINARGNNTLYRGILMPLSSDGDTIDYVFGVINWKELADPETTSVLAREVDRSLRSVPAPAPASVTPLWADGPGRPLPRPDAPTPGWPAEEHDHAAEAPLAPPMETEEHEEADAALADCLAAARNTADMLRSADVRGRGALYRALGLAYDFSCAAVRNEAQYAELLADAGIRVQRRAPMTAIVKLVFGADYDKTRLTEFAAVLSHGHRTGVPAGAMRPLLERREGGVKAIVAEERTARRAVPRADPGEALREALRAAPAHGTVSLPADGEEFVLLVGRRAGKGEVAVVAAVPPDAGLLDRAIRRLPR